MNLVSISHFLDVLVGGEGRPELAIFWKRGQAGRNLGGGNCLSRV